MPIDVNKVGNYNGNSFLGNSSAKPIVGKVLRTIFSFDITQGKLDTDTLIAPGTPVKVSNSEVSTSSGAGKQLNPNVVKIEAIAAASDISGFLLINETDILDMGATAPRAYKGQIVNVALLGSRAEIYLPVDSTVSGINTNTKLYWDTTTSTLKPGTADNAGIIELLSPVVDGIKFEVSGDDVVYKDCKVAKVRL